VAIDSPSNCSLTQHKTTAQPLAEGSAEHSAQSPCVRMSIKTGSTFLSLQSLHFLLLLVPQVSLWPVSTNS